jgi:hypothetical protein
MTSAASAASAASTFESQANFSMGHKKLILQRLTLR